MPDEPPSGVKICLPYDLILQDLSVTYKHYTCDAVVHTLFLQFLQLLT